MKYKFVGAGGHLEDLDFHMVCSASSPYSLPRGRTRPLWGSSLFSSMCFSPTCADFIHRSRYLNEQGLAESSYTQTLKEGSDKELLVRLIDLHSHFIEP